MTNVVQTLPVNIARAFILGATVDIYVKANDPRTKQPIDPTSVAIESFSRNGIPVTTSATFVRESQGVYLLRVQTANLDAGLYTIVVVATIPNATAKVQDQFLIGVAGTFVP